MGTAGTAFAQLVQDLSNNVASVVIDGATAGANPTIPFVGLIDHGSGASGVPKAYLTMLVFDLNYNLVNSAFKQIGASAEENGTDVAHQYLKINPITITEPGYVYIYLSNENGTPVEVFFDDFTVAHTNTDIVQKDDYYPFGLTFNHYEKSGTINQRFKFQGQEHIDDLGINWDSFKWRNHQPDLGRFFNVDPLAEEYHWWSPYAFSGNMVVNARELEGLEPYIVTGRTFIPQKTLDNPIPFSSNKSFAGDNRDNYDVNSTSFRTEQKVRLDIDNQQSTTLSNVASSTTAFDSNGNVSERSQPGQAGPNPTITFDGNTATVNMQVDASNKLVFLAPSINYNVNIIITQNKDGTFSFSINGESDGFPGYEFFVTDEATGKSTLMYGSNPNETGDTPNSLFPPMEKVIDESGDSGDDDNN